MEGLVRDLVKVSWREEKVEKDHSGICVRSGFVEMEVFHQHCGRERLRECKIHKAKKPRGEVSATFWKLYFIIFHRYTTARAVFDAKVFICEYLRPWLPKPPVLESSVIFFIVQLWWLGCFQDVPSMPMSCRDRHMCSFLASLVTLLADSGNALLRSMANTMLAI